MHLTRHDYCRRYAISAWEWERVDNEGFKPGTHTALLHETRFRWLLDRVGQILHATPHQDKQDKPVILDVGCFPGTFDRIIRDTLGQRVKLIGAGLCLNNSFKSATTDIYDHLLEIELDPLHPQAKPGVPNSIPLADESVDMLIAGEIFEHFYSPLHFIQEASRVLKLGGHLLLTTPNVCYIGNAFRLLQGKSCHENLNTSHLFKADEWRAHVRVYAAAELIELMHPFHLTPREICHLRNHEENCYKFCLKRWLNMQAINALSFMVPYWRNQLCCDFQKSAAPS